MVGIEMRSFGVKLALFADIDDRLAETFSISGLPIGSGIVVREIDENKRGIPDLGAHDVVDHARSRDVAQINQVVADSFLYCGLDNVSYQRIEYGVTKFHCDEAIVSSETPSLLGIISFPSG